MWAEAVLDGSFGYVEKKIINSKRSRVVPQKEEEKNECGEGWKARARDMSSVGGRPDVKSFSIEQASHAAGSVVGARASVSDIMGGTVPNFKLSLIRLEAAWRIDVGLIFCLFFFLSSIVCSFSLFLAPSFTLFLSHEEREVEQVKIKGTHHPPTLQPSTPKS